MTPLGALSSIILVAQPLGDAPPEGPPECPASVQVAVGLASWPSLADSRAKRAVRAAVDRTRPGTWASIVGTNGVLAEGYYWYEAVARPGAFTWTAATQTRGYRDAQGVWHALSDLVLARCDQLCDLPVNAVVPMRGPIVDDAGAVIAAASSVRPPPTDTPYDAGRCAVGAYRQWFQANAAGCLTQWAEESFDDCRDPSPGFPYGGYFYVASPDGATGTGWDVWEALYLVQCDRTFDRGSQFDWWCDCEEPHKRPADCCTSGTARPCGAATAVGACHGGTERCVDRRWTTTCEGEVRPSAERCNGVDDDCDGRTDEEGFDTGVGGRAHPGDTCTIGYDACASAGHWRCVSDTRVACDAPLIERTPEVCDDGRDNDCDGTTDARDDDADGFWRYCDARPGSDCYDQDWRLHPGGPEPCNGRDDDCDGDGDDVEWGLGMRCTAPGACGAGVLECLDTATAICSSDPRGSESGARREECDGTDDDCDGLTDEDFSVGALCAGARGVCAIAGRLECAGTQLVRCSTWPGGSASPASPERCNGLDDDCDGLTDEEFHVGEACTRGVGECARRGVYACTGDVFVPVRCNARPGRPKLEACDGLDNDCNGITDEGYAGQTCSVGIGDCRSTGFLICEAGALGPPRCSVAPAPPGREACDGRDNDCDGEVDEGFDFDGDGYVACTLGNVPGDCDDGNAAVHPNAKDDCSGANLDCEGPALGPDCKVSVTLCPSSLVAVPGHPIDVGVAVLQGDRPDAFLAAPCESPAKMQDLEAALLSFNNLARALTRAAFVAAKVAAYEAWMPHEPYEVEVTIALDVAPGGHQHLWDPLSTKVTVSPSPEWMTLARSQVLMRPNQVTVTPAVGFGGLVVRYTSVVPAVVHMTPSVAGLVDVSARVTRWGYARSSADALDYGALNVLPAAQAPRSNVVTTPVRTPREENMRHLATPAAGGVAFHADGGWGGPGLARTLDALERDAQASADFLFGCLPHGGPVEREVAVRGAMAPVPAADHPHGAGCIYFEEADFAPRNDHTAQWMLLSAWQKGCSFAALPGDRGYHFACLFALPLLGGAP